MTYANFPFEQAAELKALGSEANVYEMYSQGIGRGIKRDGFHLVAVNQKDEVVGFVAVRPLHAENGRVSSSVCSLVRIAVASPHRATGVGRALLKRSVETANALGYGGVMASIPENLVPWYKKQQWEIGESGHLYALLEQPHLGDDRYAPGQPTPEFRGTYAPIQLQEPGPVEHGYTRIAHRSTGAKSDLIHTWTALGAAGATQALWMTLCERPQLIHAVPKMTLVALVQEINPPQGNDPGEMMAMMQIMQRISL